MLHNRLVTSATLYDANFKTNVEEFAPQYSNPSYTPLWKIKATSAVLEDLEGNSVTYIFDFDDGDPSTSVATAYLSTEQTSTSYNEIVTRGEPSSYDWEDDEWYFADEGLTTWDFIFNTRDNASQNAVGSDNYNVALDAQEIIIDGPMYPISCRWTDTGSDTSPVKYFLSGQYYNWCSVDVPTPRSDIDPSSYDPSTDPDFEYKVEVYNTGTSSWDILYDYGDAQPSPPASASADMTGLNSYWVLSDASTYPTYRMRIRNVLEEEGFYSTEVECI